MILTPPDPNDYTSGADYAEAVTIWNRTHRVLMRLEKGDTRTPVFQPRPMGAEIQEASDRLFWIGVFWGLGVGLLTGSVFALVILRA